MSKIFIALPYPNYNCQTCGGAVGYDTLTEAMSKLEKPDADSIDPWGAVVEVATVRVWRMIDGKPMQVVVDAGEYFKEND